jgi:hypothetical protein
MQLILACNMLFGILWIKVGEVEVPLITAKSLINVSLPV